jgi:hypothetical protein
MRLGVDFDNTIVCYDQVFHQVALAEGMIDPQAPTGKEQVRDHLRDRGGEEDWILLQGLVYGARLNQAPPFPGVREFFRRAIKRGVEIFIISHKTRAPYRGPAYDLHQAALEWLAQMGFHDPAGVGLSRQRVFLELTKQDKLARIARLGCTHFIDDLPEFLAEPDFPAITQPILFAPQGRARSEERFVRLDSWFAADQVLAVRRERAA